MLSSTASRNIPDDRVTVPSVRRQTVTAGGKSASGNIAICARICLQER